MRMSSNAMPRSKQKVQSSKTILNVMNRNSVNRNPNAAERVNKSPPRIDRNELFLSHHNSKRYLSNRTRAQVSLPHSNTLLRDVIYLYDEYDRNRNFSNFYEDYMREIDEMMSIGFLQNYNSQYNELHENYNTMTRGVVNPSEFNQRDLLSQVLSFNADPDLQALLNMNSTMSASENYKKNFIKKKEILSQCKKFVMNSNFLSSGNTSGIYIKKRDKSKVKEATKVTKPIIPIKSENIVSKAPPKNTLKNTLKNLDSAIKTHNLGTMAEAKKINTETTKESQVVKKELPTCIICISEIAIGSKTLMIQCGHMFHMKCIEKWILSEYSCPTCRFKMKK